MTLHIATLARTVEPSRPDSGLGALRTEQGNLPLRGLDVNTHVTGLVARTVVTQRFHNPHSDPLEATYVFPLPERAAVTRMTMTVAGREVTAELQERGQARARYDKAIERGNRAAIAEADRADVFTMRVGNILPDENASVRLEIVGPLAWEDGQATLRIPLVVAPRYIPGRPLDRIDAGDGRAPDTDEVPDASRITPPVLLPGFPNPVELDVSVTIDPGGLELSGVESSLHTTEAETDGERTTIRIHPGERVDRDFILRFAYGHGTVDDSLITAPDADGETGTYQVTVLPPRQQAGGRPRHVVILLDRSGSMKGWKMVAARRAAARIVDTLSDDDTFAVRCFDHEIVAPPGEDTDGLTTGTDRHRYRAVEFISRIEARGGTEMSRPLIAATDLLAGTEGERTIVLVTDGQVGNEDMILAELDGRLAGIRIHVVGIDRAVNAGFLHRLCLAGRGRLELVESEDRLDVATAHIHRRIVEPVLSDVSIEVVSGELVPDSMAPARVTDVFSGVPFVAYGRYRGASPRLRLSGTDAAGRPWSTELSPQDTVDPTALGASWARTRLRDLEDTYASTSDNGQLSTLESEIVRLSLSQHVLSRFTAFVAVDSEVVNENGTMRRITQPVEYPQGWEVPQLLSGGPIQVAATSAPPMAPMGFAPSAPSGPPPAPGGPPPAFGAPPPVAGGVRSGAPTAPGAPRGAVGPRMLGRPAVQRPVRSAGIPPRDVGQALRQELQAIRATSDGSTGSEQQHRMELSDLGTRLDLIASRIAAAQFGDADAVRDRLRRLATALAECESPRPPTGSALTDLRRHAEAELTALVEILDRVIGSEGTTTSGGGDTVPPAGMGGDGTGKPQGPRHRGASSGADSFWRRPGGRGRAT
ncbi:Ca-activated chloride channel family protein [Stackebrandtia endophytica]|uniref:Ca-activated chloride channel family protein n=1 Tax=Stackebrandtia endophytica TaxID=1496996 RepID=A0A543AQF7_9ACTN|nr:VIT domain-containing protein [Stackebrandtia endophytica]TQL74808.1 Ca-activated chloride channel family protein [Stackebrandtia endophytica]